MKVIDYGMDEHELRMAIRNLLDALQPMVPYKIDPLEFCREAHHVKDGLIESALAHLPAELVEDVKRRKAEAE